ncbi:hypothetical protein, partial [Glutamicibacter arilaitensis]|uniref:hypothetical protein n=1 Tax=Glutamicibacter arilaitensis TaxID=256701 RepID=UPI003F8E4070
GIGVLVSGGYTLIPEEPVSTLPVSLRNQQHQPPRHASSSTALHFPHRFPCSIPVWKFAELGIE